MRKDAHTDVVSGKIEYDQLGRVVTKNDVETETDGTFTSLYTGRQGTPSQLKYFYDELSRVVMQGKTNTVTHERFYGKTTYEGLFKQLATDAKGNIKETQIDEFGRVSRAIDYVGQNRISANLYATVDYFYDTLGNLTNTRDSKGNRVNIVYDELSRKTNFSDPDLGNISYQYNLFSDITNQIDAKNQKICTFFDKRGRVTNKTHFALVGTADVDYEYGTNGFSRNRLTSVEDESGKQTYEYDQIGNVTNVTKAIGAKTYFTGYDYDALGCSSQHLT